MGEAAHKHLVARREATDNWAYEYWLKVSWVYEQWLKGNLSLGIVAQGKHTCSR